MEDNYILAEINIQESDINKDIRIIILYVIYYSYIEKKSRIK